MPLSLWLLLIKHNVQCLQSIQFQFQFQFGELKLNSSNGRALNSHFSNSTLPVSFLRSFSFVLQWLEFNLDAKGAVDILPGKDLKLKTCWITWKMRKFWPNQVKLLLNNENKKFENFPWKESVCDIYCLWNC